MAPDLTDEETAALIRLLAKFRPEPPRQPLPPPPKVYAPPRASAASRRGNRR